MNKELPQLEETQPTEKSREKAETLFYDLNKHLDTDAFDLFQKEKLTDPKKLAELSQDQLLEEAQKLKSVSASIRATKSANTREIKKR